MNKLFSLNPRSTDLQNCEDSYEDIYVNEIPQTRRTRNFETPLPSASDPRPAGRRRYRLAVVCLLMLVVLLLAAITILGVNFKNLTTEKDQLETSYQKLASLNTSYRSVVEERDQFQQEIDQLETSYKELQKNASCRSVVEERDQFQQEIDELQKKYSQLQEDIDTPGWKYFSSSIYFISTEKKSWSESRHDCQGKGADLVIINSKEEQDMIEMWRKNEGFWIGANDQNTEGVWKWVDGTPVSNGFWKSGEPNNVNEEDCAVSGYVSVPNWYDVSCSTKYIWICEKRINS